MPANQLHMCLTLPRYYNSYIYKQYKQYKYD